MAVVLLVAWGRIAVARADQSSAELVSGSVTFNRDIAPIVFAQCSTCHRPEGSAPFSLMTYSQVKARARQVAEVTEQRVMPPWKPVPGYGEFEGERRLSEAEIHAFRAWVEQGAVEGDSPAPPKPSVPSGGWQLGQPDVVLEFPHPYLLSAGGPDILRNFVVPIPIATRRYVTGIEFLPNNPQVVHHANMRIDETRASRRLDDEDEEPGYEGVTAPSAHFPAGHFLGWTPGQIRRLAPEGLSWPLAPGTDLVVQLHLRPTGKPERVAPAIGIYFTDTPPIRLPSMIRLDRQSIDIAPGEREYVVKDEFVLPVDVELHEIQPHAHYLAREVEGLARLPDGSTRWLIYIKDWDFAWQDVYRLVPPLWLPRGTTLTMRYRYDNSAENPRNPHHPPRRVRYGQASTDEMGNLWLQVFTRTHQERVMLDRQVQAKILREDIVGYQQMLAADPEDSSLYQNLADAYLQLGEGDVALSHLRTSLRLDPRSAFAHANMGTALLRLGRASDAIPYLEEALRLKVVNPSPVHNSLGLGLQALGRFEEALVQFREALALDPIYSFAHNNLGRVLQSLGQTELAVQHLERAIAIRPEDPIPHRNLATTLMVQGLVHDALAHFRLALAQSPDWLDVLLDVAWILAAHPDADVRDPEEAVRLASHAAEVTNHGHPGALDVLAVAHAATLRFDRAIVIGRTALELAVGAGNAELAAAIRSRLGLFAQRQPYRGLFPVPPERLSESSNQ